MMSKAAQLHLTACLRLTSLAQMPLRGTSQTRKTLYAIGCLYKKEKL